MAAVALVMAGLFESCVSQTDEMFVLNGSQSASEIREDVESTASEEQETADTIWVYVCGEVQNPGVYELKAGSRIFEAVEAAGGMSSQAAAEAVNLASPLADGQQVQIPSVQQAQTAASIAAEQTQGELVALNSATKEQLMQLSGIGESKAQAILDYRQEHGRFESLEEIKQVPGIGETLFDQIKNDITLDEKLD